MLTEHIRSLVYILFFATLFFVFAQRFACTITDCSLFTRRRNLWFALTLAAFLSQGFWLYLVVAILLVAYVYRRESNPAALYFFILFVLPMAYIKIPGFGVLNFIFELSHARVLSLLILLPAFLALRKQNDYVSFGRGGSADKVLAAYLILVSALYLREFTLTNNLRQIFYLFIDVFLPYIVISRSLKTMQNFRDALLSLVLAIMVLAPLAVFEYLKFWLVYRSLPDSLGMYGEMGGYMARDGMLRTVVSAGHSIALGYLMVVGLGLFLYMQSAIKQKFIRWLGMILLAIGLITPLSRGPWVGAVVLLIVFIATGRNPVPRLMSLALAAMLALFLVSTLPGGEKVLNLLPFIGTTDQFNVDYRDRLLTNSIIVIERNFWFGSTDFRETPEMIAMIQGEGIVDLVNTYLGIGLDKGMIGLSLFVAFFAQAALGILRGMRSIPNRNSEEHLLGRALLATLMAILVIIFTVSSVTIIPIVYWSIAGVCVAYPRMVRKHMSE
jgi:hypothetical protein